MLAQLPNSSHSAGYCLLRAKWWAGDFTCCGSLHSYRLSAYQTGWDQDFGTFGTLLRTLFVKHRETM